jgi:hypothetical protein
MAAGGEAALGLIPGLEAGNKARKALGKADDVADAAGDVGRTSRGKPGSYTPDRTLPTDEHGVPIPDSPYPHTQLGRSKPKSPSLFDPENIMTRYWIFDRDDTPQGFPLQKLFRRIQGAFGMNGCKIVLRRSEGHGTQMRAWEDLLEKQDEILVSPREFDSISAGTAEWFYNLEAECTSGGASVTFGLHDSSALFVETTPELAREITSIFAGVRVGDR